MSEQPNHNSETIWKAAQLITTICSLVLVAIVVPWGTWVTGQIFDLQKQQLASKAWQDIAPRYTEKDAALGRAVQEKEWSERLDKKLDEIMALLRKHMNGGDKP